MTRDEFKKGMDLLAVLPGGEVDKVRLEVYYGALQHLDLAEFLTAVAAILKTRTFFPVPAEILELARPRNLDAEAGRVFERIQAMSEHNPRTGAFWRETSIRLALGDAAADAYQAAGGSAAMAHGDPVWTRKAFVEAYVKRPPAENPLTALPPSGHKALPAVADARVAALSDTIGRLPTRPDPDAKRAAYIDQASERNQR